VIKKSFCSHKALIIPASNGVVRVNVEGSFFLCKESDDTFQMSLDNGEKFDFEAGLSFELKEGDFFKVITFFNSTASDISVEFYAANGNVKDSRFNNLVERNTAISITAIPTRVVVTEDSLGNGLTLSLAEQATIPGTLGTKKRKQIVITNESTDDNLVILNSAGGRAGVVFAETAWTLETNDTLIILNPGTNTGDVVCSVSETYPT